MAPPFSRRLDWDSAENALARAERVRRAAGDLLDLTVTNPTAVGLTIGAGADDPGASASTERTATTR